MFQKRSWSYWLILISILGISVWIFNTGFADNRDLYYKLDKGLFYLKQVYETISHKYVDDVDPEGLSKAAIRGIVDQLDPYTVFFEKKGSENLKIITRGKYGGLGMEISKREGKITVIAPIDNTPAQRAGIRAGDVINKIDGEPTENMTLDEASSKLRGKVGTKVTIEILRPGVSEPITLTLTREEIVLKDVTYADFVEPGVAYFRLTSFSDKAASELKEAIARLQEKGEIKQVVLDLRGNPGGLLASAVEVANIFLPRGEVVVKTKGSHEEETVFTTTEEPLLPDVPLAVLVNNGSASASEIVAGAIQDLDRGVIVGRRTFGKGLVQQVYPLDKLHDVYLKITTAKYYIPSGRCIQKEDYKKNKEIFTDLEDPVDIDSLVGYHTKNGREVHGGGGIKPDVKVPAEKPNPLLISLWSKGYFFRFTVDYLAKHPEIKTLDQIQVDDGILEEFKAYLDSNKLEYEIDGESELKDFLKIAAKDSYSVELRNLVSMAVEMLDIEKDREFNASREKIARYLLAEFAEKLGGTNARIAVMLKSDRTLKKALEVLNQPERYREILAIKE